MIDHLRDSINQIFPPEPPDDPRPDPTPPPDDALPACPVCGAPVMFWSDEDGIYAFCSGDMQRCAIDGPTRPTMAEAAAEWRRIARAAALLRAVERLESALRHEVDAVGLYRNGWRIRGVYNWPGGAVADTDSAADSLIALAAQMEDRDA